MNFYFSFFQLTEDIDRIEQNINYLAGKALRISPRDARANRELLEQCGSRITEIKHLLNTKTHISKITLRKSSILFQLVQLFYQRLINLTTVVSSIGAEDEESMKCVWQLIGTAQRHYQILIKALYGLTGIPVEILFPSELVESFQSMEGFLKNESHFQQEALKLLERSLEIFGEDQELSDTLILLRKELLEIRKRMKHFIPENFATTRELSHVSSEVK
jgi:hypothetical protein